MKCALSGEPELPKVLAENFEDLFAATRDLASTKEGATVAMLSGAMSAAKELAAVL